MGLGLGCRAPVPAQPPLAEAERLAVFDPAAQADGRPVELGPLPELELRDYGPEGVGEGDQGGSTHGEKIRVRFNQPVVDMSQAPEPGADVLGLWRLSPEGEPAAKVPGHARWTAPDVLEWQPEASGDEDALVDVLPAATAFEARFAGGLTNREGSRVDGVAWRFETARPTVRWLEDWGAVKTDQTLYVMSDQPMRAEALAEHLRLMAPPREGASPRPVPLRVAVIEEDQMPPYWRDELYGADLEQRVVFAITPRDRWPVGARARLEIDAGLTGEAGPLPLAEPYVARLHILDRLRVRGLQCEQQRGRSCEPGWIRLELSNELTNEELERIEVYPRPADLEAWQSHFYPDEEDDDDDDENDDGDEDEDEDDHDDDHDDDQRVGLILSGNFEPGRRYRITLPASITDEYGQTLGRRYQTTVSIREPEPEVPEEGSASLRLSSYQGTFLRPQDARLGVLASRVDEARIRVAVLEPEALRALLRAKDLDEEPWPTAATTTVVLRRMATRGADAHAQEVISLADFGGAGQAFLVEVAANVLTPTGRDEPVPEPARGLFQISDLGALVDLGPARGTAWVTRATDGKPWAGVEGELHTTRSVVPLRPSSADGLIALPGADELGNDVLLALHDPTGGDALVLPLRDYAWSSSKGAMHWSWPQRYIRATRPPLARGDEVLPRGLRPGEKALVELEVGRGIYLPGDAVHVAGWAGVATPHREISTRRLKAGTPVEIELRRRHDVMITHRTTVNRHGRFAASLTLPEGAPLDYYEVRAHVLESWGSTSLMVADARIPTFEIESSASPHSVIRGETVVLRVRAKALSGEPAPLEELQWHLGCWASDFRPRGYDWPWSFGRLESYPSHSDGGTLTPKRPQAELEVRLQTELIETKRMHSCQASVAGHDVSFQEVGAVSNSFEVHPTRTYVGLRPPRDAEVGERVELEVVAVDTKGRRVALREVEVTIVREPEMDRRTMLEPPPPIEVARCRVEVAATGEHPRCAVAEPVAGNHRARATAVVDGVPVEAEAKFTVEEAPPPEPAESEETDAGDHEASAGASGPEPPAEPERRFEILAPEEAHAGKAIALEITAPWDEGTGLLSVTHTGLRESIPFELRDGRATVSITPHAGRGKRLELAASVARPDSDGELPQVRKTEAWVKVLEPRALEVEIDAPAQARPRQEVPLRLSVRDGDGKPVDARLAVWVVDDGLHQLRAPRPAQLAVTFDPDRPGDRQRTLGHDDLLRPFVPWAFGGRGHRSPRVRQAKAQVKGALDVEVRQHFEAVPLFVGDVGTGPDGEVELTLPLPDDLTRFRVTAVASAELPRQVGTASGPARFGRGTAEIEVSMALVVRAALPRVLRPGDTAEVAALVTTPPKKAGTVTVEASLREADGVLAATRPLRRRVRVEPGRPTRVPFDVRALGPGRPAVRFVARFVPDDGGPALGLREGVERTLEVEVERTEVERAAIYGRLDRDGPSAIPVLIPRGVRPDHGELRLSLGSTALGDLDEAARYLVEYPHGCVEQTASRLLPLLALQGLAHRLPEALDQPDAFVAEQLSRLVAMQRGDGSFGYWSASDDEAEQAGAYVTWVLQMAAEAGQPVPSTALEQAYGALLARLDRPLPDRAWARADARALRALAVHALVRGGRGDEAVVATALDDLVEHRNGLPVFAQALVLMALHGRDPADPRIEVMQRRLSSLIESLPGHAQVVDPGRRYWWLFDSRTRSQAMILLAFLQVTPDDPLVDDLARGLTLMRHAGRWRNTQENAYSLLAMAGYAKVREAEVPDHRVEAWIGPRRVLATEQRGRSEQTHEVSLPMASVLGPVGSDRTTHVVLDREGEGALFYRLGMEWVGSEPAPARSQGIELQRTLEGPQGPLSEREGVELEAGQRYAIEVVVETDAPQHYLAIEVPLPAGLEAIDTRLGQGTEVRAFGVLGRGYWMSHEELRRDRVVLYADELQPGRYVHQIHVLATTPGSYVLPAAVAEGMYTPEVRARTTAGRVRVVER
ncbi:alpha-2-macroglobulin family protein [Paraliomyxa miuraensis]|uniref:alpha-2-macroglobulin family protein n=1 Tax=Paraliomyxa miuraensis TaxID=376150 RepID=UPI0022578B66|nr:alpha-2-macroglobulin family protein [Paraliomyxa miuraensis]MCX4244379.1 hypothetical protein [Paraliomyxa miuraensis]